MSGAVAAGAPEARPAAFDAYAGDYAAALAQGLRYSGEDSTFFAHGRIRWLAGRLAQLGERPASVLDYGCGVGTATPYLLDLPGAPRVVGTDPSEKAIDVARARHASERARFVGLAEPAEDAFDLAHCNGVFHHIERPERPRAVGYLRRALRSGGVLAFFENNPWNPGTRLVMRRIPFDRDAVTLSASEARRMLRAAGFEVVRTDFLFVFPAALARLRPLEARLASLPLGAQYLVLARKAQ